MATKMSAIEITERINKTEEAIKKLENLIQKRINERLPKLENEWEAETDENKKYWKSCDIKHLKEDIENGKKKLEEKKATLKKWQDKLEEVNETDKIIRKIPEQLYKLMEQIREEMIKERTEFRDTMIKDYSEMKRNEFREKYRYADFYKVYYQTDEDIVKEANRDSKYYIIDLVHRVTKKVGEITKWELWDAGNELNGWVWGTRGRAEIETILAGGYNIQCLHNRVLVK